MRIYCKECGSKGRIASRDELSMEFASSIVSACHTWVANLTFSHTLSPSAQAVDRLIFDRLRDMSCQQQREMFYQLGLFGTSPG